MQRSPKSWISGLSVESRFKFVIKGSTVSYQTDSKQANTGPDQASSQHMVSFHEKMNLGCTGVTTLYIAATAWKCFKK